MKTLGATLLVLIFSGFFLHLRAQSQPASSMPLGDADHAIVQSWLESDQPSEVKIEGDRLILAFDDRNAMCAYMRVYRVKREVPGSDLTRPAGYTTCVGASRFTMKTSTKPKAAPSQ